MYTCSCNLHMAECESFNAVYSRMLLFVTIVVAAYSIRGDC